MDGVRRITLDRFHSTEEDMSLLKQETLATLKKHTSDLGIDVSAIPDDRPVRLVHEEAVPIRGSVHIALGLVRSREDVDREFAAMRFTP